MADISKVKLPDNSEYDIKDAAARSGSARDSTKMPLAGGTFTGAVKFAGVDLTLGTGTSSSDDSGDLIWSYGDNSEKMRLYAPNTPTAKFAPFFREYTKDGTSLYNGYLVLGDGTGASGTWGISISGNAATATSATKATQDSDGNTINSTYLKLSGGTLTGNLTISHATSADMSASSANPKITFAENGTQPVHLIYTDYDNYRNPAGLKVIGGTNATPAWFEVEGSIYNGGSIYTSAAVCANTANSGSAGGLALYGTEPTDYGIAFRVTGNSGKHGYVQTDWAQYHYMSDSGTGRGWVFRNKSTTTNVASINTSGNMVLNGSLTVGGNATNTNGCRMVFNSTLNCLDFQFAS